MPVHAHLAGELRHHFGNDHFPVAISGNAKRRCDRIGRRERGLGNNIHADLPALQKAQENLDDAFRQLLFLGIGYEKAKNLTMQIIERRRPDHDKN